MRLYNYLEGIEVKETNVSYFDTDIKGVTSRTEEIKDGYIFVCINGMNVDGHDYSVEARRKGAKILVVERITKSVLESRLPYIRVDNTRKVLPLMCAKSYGNPERYLKLIALTGTNGKTSACRIISEIYKNASFSVHVLGTLNGRLTTDDPEDLFRKLKECFDSGCDTVIMEASSHALALDKLNGICFDIGVFTNLTAEHLDFHKTMDDYAKAKSKLFASSKRGLYNCDDVYWEKVSSNALGRKYTYSIKDQKADYYVRDCVFYGVDGFEYLLVNGDTKINIRSKLCGSFNLYNTLASASVALCDGIDGEYIKKGIEGVSGVNGRLEKLMLDAPFSIYIDYAHTPDALEKVLLCIRSFKREDQKITLLFGCGGDRDKTKRKPMGQIASKYADFVIVTSDNSRSEKAEDIIDDILKGIDKERPYTVIENRKEAIEYAVLSADDNDIILFAGKGHENYEIDSNGKRYFNEREIAAHAVCKRFNKNDH